MRWIQEYFFEKWNIGGGFDLGHWLVGILVIARPGYTHVSLGVGPVAIWVDRVGV